MNLFGLTDTGLVRKDNQDSYVFQTIDESLSFAVVCDGMGGAQAGNVASTVAVETFAAAIEKASKDGIPSGAEEREELLRVACYAANKQVYDLSQKHSEYQGMGTTLVAMLALPHEVYVVNIGDSRCYIQSSGKLTQITSDHSLVQALVDRGDITPDEARIHPQKHLITRALGIEEKVRCDVFEVERQEGNTLLLCSDGLSNVVPEDLMLQTLENAAELEQAAHELLRLAMEQGAPDNVTVVLARV